MSNELPEEVVDTGTVPTFKRHLDRVQTYVATVLNAVIKDLEQYHHSFILTVQTSSNSLSNNTVGISAPHGLRQFKVVTYYLLLQEEKKDTLHTRVKQLSSLTSHMASSRMPSEKSNYKKCGEEKPGNYRTYPELPVACHFNAPPCSLANICVSGLLQCSSEAQGKLEEQHLIFRLGTLQ
eukprot:g45091.t1